MKTFAFSSRSLTVAIALLMALCLAPIAATAATLTYDFTGTDITNGLQGWTQLYPTNLVGEPLWASYDNWWFGPDLGHLGDGWEDRNTQLGRSPQFYLDGSGDMTCQWLGGTSPNATPVAPSAIPEIAIVAGGFMGVALRDVAAETYVLSKARTTTSTNEYDVWTNLVFSASDLSPFANDGKQYTLDFIDYDKNPGVGGAWVILGTASIPGSTNLPTGTVSEMLTFGLPGKTGVIVGTSIDWTLPYGTAVTNLAPDYTLSAGATCDKPSGSTNDFTSPQVFTVVSSNGLYTNVYTVTVTVAPVSMLTFGPGAVITGTDISWIVPFGSDLTQLAPTYTLSAYTTCNPPSGSINDFTSPVMYTVTSEDLSTSVVYTVTVSFPYPPLTFDFTNGLQGWTQIYPTNPADSVWENNNSWEPADNGHLGTGWENPGETRWARSPEFYIDNSGDMTFQFWGGQAYFPPPAAPSDIPPTNQYRSGYMGVALRDVATDTYVLWKGQLSNQWGFWIEQSFTQAELAPYTNNLRRYTLDFIDYDWTDGDTNRPFSEDWGWIWLSNVSIPGSTNLPMLTFGLPGKPAVIVGTSIDWTLPYGTVLTSLAPDYTLSAGATCDKPSGSTNDFSSPQVYTVVHSGGLYTNVYTVTVTVAPVSMLTFGPGAVITGTDISWVVPVGSDLTQLAPTYTISAYTSCNPPSGSTNDFTSPVMYTVTSEDLSTSVVYTVTAIVPIPFVDITNIDGATNMPSGTTTFTVEGTNNLYTVGDLWWTNSLGGSGVFGAGLTGWMFNAAVTVGANVITVYGSNAAGDLASASATVNIVPAPFVDITNIDGTTNMPSGTTTFTVEGTNNMSTVGDLWWTNSLGGSGMFGAGLTGWMFNAAVAVGANVITVYGSNALGTIVSDSATVVVVPAPFVDITNIDGTTNVPIDTTTFTVEGTNNMYTVGALWWTNSLGGSGMFGAGLTGWMFNASVMTGANVITVYGINAAGEIASDSVTVDVVPEPTAILLLGLLALCGRSRR